ncbi:MAG: DNA-binding protein HU-beta, partial [Pseudomonadota bacterium]|nr:DNA-binding protein HU-beta [Pseudomonadota bacterium]
MNKAELIDAIASGADISKVKAGEVIDAFVSTVTSALKNGDTVTLVGFGSFTTAERAARTG